MTVQIMNLISIRILMSPARFMLLAISASNLSGTNTGDVTIGTANGLSLVGQALSLATASGSTTGALTSTDWTTFNNKQPAGSYITALTGDVTASGPGSVAATVASVGGVSAANVAAVQTLLMPRHHQTQ
jgi:hypothetical protein